MLDVCQRHARKSFEEPSERNLRLGSGERRTQAEVNASTEGNVGIR